MNMTYLPRTIEIHAVVSSTNDRVATLLKQPEPPKLPCLVLTQHQTTGRGRGGKTWWSGSGALLMSLGMESESLGLTRLDFSLLSITVALSLLETLGTRLPAELAVELHWPNDVHVGGRKISGILIESPSPRFLVIGIGVNVNNSLFGVPPEFQEEFQQRQVTSMIDLLGKKTNIPALIVDFLHRFHYNVDETKRNPANVMSRAESCCVQVGRDVTVVTGEQTVAGRCLGITETGALRLQTSDGEITLNTGITT